MTDPKPTDPSLQSGSYALNALDADEVAAFEAHLATSPETRNEVTELGDTAVLLGLAITPEAPPASLKSSIMAQLDATPQLAPIAEAAPGPALGPAETRARARWTARPIASLAAAAAVLGLIAGGGIVATAIVQSSERQTQADAVSQITAAADVQRQSVDLANGTATLVWSEQLQSSALIVDGLERLPGHQVYELWYIDDAGARSAGTFTVGSGESTHVLAGTMRAGDTVGVTVEPRGGSPVPTTDPVILVPTA